MSNKAEKRKLRLQHDNKDEETGEVICLIVISVLMKNVASGNLLLL